MNQINTIVKTLFRFLSDDKMNDINDTVRSDYTAFNYKNGTFVGDDFIWSSKDIREVNSHIWN